jgi:ABC-type uncharacterized transport system involved in gliding motility auxiliary subunit
VTPLFTTSNAGGIESGRAFIAPQRDFPTDSLAPRLIAASVSPTASDESEDLAGRVVVVGNSDFATDAYGEGGTGGVLFALNAVDWLSQDAALIQIRSKDRRPPPLVFESQTTQTLVKYANVAGIPLVLVLFAALRLWRRRQRAQLVYEPSGGTP